MKTVFRSLSATLMFCLMLSGTLLANDPMAGAELRKDLKTFVIEREMPGVQNLTHTDLVSASQNSCSVIKDLGPDIVWLHSYVSENKIYCVYQASDKEIIRKHAEQAGFPANSIKEVATVISPATAEE